MTTLSLNPIVDISVYISPLSAPRRTFDQGLIIGNTAIIPITERIRQYTEIDAILEDGFTSSSPEYQAAVKYFSQSPAPTYLWLGRQDLVASKIDEWDINSGGSGYSVGDILTVVQSGGSLATLSVSSVSSGAVTGATLTNAGTGYSAATGLSTTVSPSGGTGCTIDITAVRAETCLEAVTACRAKGSDWYICTVLDAAKADHIAIAEYIEAATPTSYYMFTTDDADVLSGTSGNVIDTLHALGYTRTWGRYTSSDYTAACEMGRAMGLNTGLAGSAFTMKFKDLTGETTEDLTTTQVTNLEGRGCNLYLNRGSYYDMLEQGVNIDGSFFDETLFLDMLTNNIQLNVMDLLYQTTKVPQTDAGVTELIHQVNRACSQSVDIGFIAPGKWTGVTVLNLKNGDTLPAGYLVQAQAVADQDDADREARKAPPIYCAIKEAGAVHSVVIGVYVDR